MSHRAQSRCMLNNVCFKEFSTALELTTCFCAPQSRYKIWRVAVVQPARMDNRVVARTMGLAALMVVTS